MRKPHPIWGGVLSFDERAQGELSAVGVTPAIIDELERSLSNVRLTLGSFERSKIVIDRANELIAALDKVKAIAASDLGNSTASGEVLMHLQELANKEEMSALWDLYRALPHMIVVAAKVRDKLVREGKRADVAPYAGGAFVYIMDSVNRPKDSKSKKFAKTVKPNDGRSRSESDPFFLIAKECLRAIGIKDKDTKRLIRSLHREYVAGQKRNDVAYI